MREIAENASSLTNRTAAKNGWRRGIATLALVVAGALGGWSAFQSTATAQTRQTAQAASTGGTRSAAQTRQTAQTASTGGMKSAAQTRQTAQTASTGGTKPAAQTRQTAQTTSTGGAKSAAQTRQTAQTAEKNNALSSASEVDGVNEEKSAVEENGENGGDGELSAEAVRSAVDGAIAFLRQKQKPNGEWDEYPGYRPGTTALCALALLSAGLDKDDPTVAKALEFLRGFSPKEQNQTYPISLQTMVFCLADPETDRARIEANVAWLVERQLKTSNEYDGGWSYVGIDQASERADNSNSQFAVLALYEAEQIGVAIDEAVWKRAENYWLRMQNDDGSWGYRASTLNPEGFPSGYGTGSMTCAGIAALAMCSGVREAARARVEGDDFVCCQDVEDEIAVRISSGLNWLGKHFSARTNPGRAAGADTYFFYYLYGLERIGRLTANRFVGRSDWYREGADALLRRKGTFSQFWNAQKDLAGNNAVSTSFALLFLSKGRWPVLVSKLKYGDGENWNAHPNDLARLTRRVEREWKTNLVWQTIDVRRATLDDLLQTPILSISGTETPLPNDAEEKRLFIELLRGYLEQGGFIFAEAIDGDVSFERGFRELIAEIAAQDGGELRLLEPEHPIWTAEKNVAPERARPIWGLDFGCRTSVVFVPAYRPTSGANGEAPSVFDDRPSLSCLWEASKPFERSRGNGALGDLGALANGQSGQNGQNEQNSQNSQSGQNAENGQGGESGTTAISANAAAEIETAFAIGLNVCAYATNREMKFKEEIPADVAAELEKTKGVRNSLFAAILECGGGSSCAPRAIPNLMKAVRVNLGIPAQLYVPRASAKRDDLFNYPTLFMHGRNAFSFGKEERERLRLYFERGGFLFANAVGSSKKFEEAFLAEIAAILPNAELVDVPADDPIFTGRYGGFKIETLQYRTRKVENGRKTTATVVEGPPRLKGVALDGRWVLLYSPDDVACALENVAAANFDGLTQKSAFRLATNILFYAAESF